MKVRVEAKKATLKSILNRALCCKRHVRTKKFNDPSPLRTVSYTVKLWPKSIEFVREENEQQEGTLPGDQDREDKINLIK